MGKFISVIVPCYNVERYIDRCIDSLVCQTIGVENLELIFVDDASTDATLERLASWERNYPESILVVACEKNGRQGTARNIGMTYAAAPYITFVDSDDWIEKDILEKLYTVAVEEKTQVTSCLVGRDFGDGKILDITRCYEEKNTVVIVDDEQKRKKLLQNGLGHLVGKLFHRDFILENELYFPENTAYEDNYFGAVMCACIHSFYVMDIAGYHYYRNTGSTVASKDALHHLERLDVEILTLDTLCEMGMEEKYYETIYGRFLKLYYLNTLHIIFTRFQNMPYDIMDEMREEVLKRFPNYMDTEFYQNLSDVEKGFLSTLEMPMEHENWDNLAQNYRYLMEQYHGQ